MTETFSKVVNRRSSTVLAIFPFIAYWTKRTDQAII